MIGTNNNHTHTHKITGRISSENYCWWMISTLLCWPSRLSVLPSVVLYLQWVGQYMFSVAFLFCFFHFLASKKASCKLCAICSSCLHMRPENFNQLMVNCLYLYWLLPTLSSLWIFRQIKVTSLLFASLLLHPTIEQCAILGCALYFHEKLFSANFCNLCRQG